MKVPMGISVTFHLFETLDFKNSNQSNRLFVGHQLSYRPITSLCCAVADQSDHMTYPLNSPPPPLLAFCNKKCHSCAMVTFAALYCAWLVHRWLGSFEWMFFFGRFWPQKAFIQIRQANDVLHQNASNKSAKIEHILFDFWSFVDCILMQYIVGLVHFNECFFWPFLVPKNIHSNQPIQRCTALKCKQQKHKYRIKYSVIFRALHAPHTIRHPHQPSAI